MDEQSGSGAGRWWPVVAVFIVVVLVALGVKAWDTGHDVAFAVLVLAGVVAVSCERIVVAVRGRR